ncbi:radical SAM protein, partial [uncultured Treponema sp.]
MRGCPNGCRFCHAGIYYRPMRVKNKNLIIEEIDHLVFDAGYREVSLNSLSSADFPEVSSLLDILNERYKGFNVSFQLPSLKVNAFSLDILEKLSKIRKSGLTFAV